MADETRKKLIEVLGELEALKNTATTDEEKSKIEDIGDKLISEFGKNLRSGGDEVVGCGAAWLYAS